MKSKLSSITLFNLAHAFIGFERSMNNMYRSIEEKQSLADPDLQFKQALFDEKTQKYNNPWKTWRRLSPADILRWKIRPIFGTPANEVKLNNDLEKAIDQHITEKKIDVPEQEYFQTRKLDWKKLTENIRYGEVRATWLGHATSLVQFSNGLNVIFDPLLEEYIGEGPNWLRKLVSPPRETELPCIPEDFKLNNVPIHIICISHNHHDHYDPKTIEKFRKVFPDVKVYSPTGTRPGRDGIELDWWSTDSYYFSRKQQTSSRRKPKLSKIRITAVPAQHWSRRGVMDENNALWSGWVIKSAGRKVYYAGDTGYAQFFKEIGMRFKKIHLAILPIGAYLPKWFMNPQHISPEEAVQVFDDVNAKHALGVHWLTFQELANERGVQPVKELEYYKYQRKDPKFKRFQVTPVAKITSYP